MRTVTISPAYGRDYKSLAKARQDYAADKDFLLQDFDISPRPVPINKTQIDAEGWTAMIRYNRLTKIGRA